MCIVSILCKNNATSVLYVCHAFHIVEHWTKSRYRHTRTFTRSESNVLLLRQQWHFPSSPEMFVVSFWFDIDACLLPPEGGSKLMGSDQNQRGQLFHFFYVNWPLLWIGLLAKVWCSHHREFREKSTQLGTTPYLS